MFDAKSTKVIWYRYALGPDFDLAKQEFHAAGQDSMLKTRSGFVRGDDGLFEQFVDGGTGFKFRIDKRSVDPRIVKLRLGELLKELDKEGVKLGKAAIRLERDNIEESVLKQTAWKPVFIECFMHPPTRTLYVGAGASDAKYVVSALFRAGADADRINFERVIAKDLTYIPIRDWFVPKTNQHRYAVEWLTQLHEKPRGGDFVLDPRKSITIQHFTGSKITFGPGSVDNIQAYEPRAYVLVKAGIFWSAEGKPVAEFTFDALNCTLGGLKWNQSGDMSGAVFDLHRALFIQWKNFALERKRHV